MVSKKFVPMDGCEKSARFRKRKEKEVEICCDGGARQCCFFCMDEGCPILEEYAKTIDKVTSSLDESNELNEEEDKSWIFTRRSRKLCNSLLESYGKAHLRRADRRRGEEYVHPAKWYLDAIDHQDGDEDRLILDVYNLQYLAKK